MGYLDWIEPTAQAIGAVNTVALENEQLLGYNTDADGLIEPLIQRMGSLAGSRAVVLGAGGAASAAVFALQHRGVDVSLYARSLERAQTICERFNISCKPLSTGFAGNDIVINATPLGSIGINLNETPAVADQLRGVRLVYDLVYNPIETHLIREARAAGCEVLGGLAMLVAQARLQFKIWTNTDASSELMYRSGSSALSKNFSRAL
jgi:shikimate dehydrogenase